MSSLPSNLPIHDSFPPLPEDWVPIKLGVGQQPNAYGGDGSFQWRNDANADGTAIDDHKTVRRNPDETFVIISRPPERP